jgi:hydroxyacylglutathione hydrolase
VKNGDEMKYLQLSKIIVFMALSFAITSSIFAQQTDSCYKAYKEADKVWRIVENNTVNIYLVEGKDTALIIDTGYGTGDLKAYVKTLTKLPLIIVNTRGHGDHVGGDSQFSKIYIHPRDFEMINSKFKKGYGTEGIANTDSMTLVSVEEGYIFDLGERKLEVIEVPGHTHGSICLLDSVNKILFAGDNTNAIVWLFLKDCYPLEVYLRSLQKVHKHIDEFDIIMPGHNTPLDRTFIKEQIACVESILDGTCSPVPYNYSDFTKRALLCKYKTSEVAYDPNKLYEKE